MAVYYDANTNCFYLEGKRLTYAFFINEVGYAEHLYFGEKIARDDLRYVYSAGAKSQMAGVPGRDDLPEDRMSYQQFMPELAFFGSGDYREPAVLAVDPAGSRLTDLLYTGHEVLKTKPEIPGMPSLDGGETLVLRLADPVSGFGAELYYTVYEDCDIVARRAVFCNDTGAELTLQRVYSFSFALPDRDYEAVTLYGAWARERAMDRTPLRHGVFSVDSKRAASSATLNPFMALVRPNTDENRGEALGFALNYSASFALKAEVNPDGTALVTGGINDFDFTWHLAAGERFYTPEVLLAYAPDGLGGMSRAFHDAYRNHMIPKDRMFAPRPIVINNWEGTYFDFTFDKLAAIAEAGRRAGADTFVLDDGWFGKRNDDHAGLGDWTVNENKLEGGLQRLTDHVHKLGMKFGLWFEPEMVNEDSHLFSAHPDWAVGAPGRCRSYTRHQFLLDVTRPEVRQYIVDAVNRILKTYDVDYVKWDFNRNATEFYSFGRDPACQQEFSHRYALGLYDICERIVNGNPRVFFEGCASGGARFDGAMLHWFPQIWTSDDTDAEERTHIQYGTSLVYPMSAMSCHVSVCPNHQTGRTTPFVTRAAIAHLGATGFELDATNLSEDEIQAALEQSRAYKDMEKLILEGDLYRLENPMEGNFFSICVVSKDKKDAFLLCYRRMGRVNNEIHRVCPAGLDESTVYICDRIGGERRGGTWMHLGIAPVYPEGDFGAVLYRFRAE